MRLSFTTLIISTAVIWVEVFKFLTGVFFHIFNKNLMMNKIRKDSYIFELAKKTY